jgi:hypothetical protein
LKSSFKNRALNAACLFVSSITRSCMPAACFLQSKIHMHAVRVGGMTAIPFKLNKQLLHCAHNRDGILKLLMSPGIDSKEFRQPMLPGGRVRQPYSN